MSVAVAGSLNLDVTAYLDRLPMPGETLHGSGYNLGLGGKGANQAAAAAKLGSEVAFVGCTGTDAFAEAALAEFRGYGLKDDFIRRDAKAGTGLAIINVGAGGENAISLIAGGNFAVTAADIERARPALETARVLLLQMEIPLAASLAAARIVRARGGLAILDPAPAPRDGFSRADLEAVDLVTPNELETAALIGWRPETPDDALKAARELRGKGARAAIVKIGARGAAYSGPDAEGFVPPFTVTPVDTVAAGDTFNGGLAHAIERGMPMLEAVRFASACGALSTTRKGAAAAAPARAEVEAFLKGQPA